MITSVLVLIRCFFLLLIVGKYSHLMVYISMQDHEVPRGKEEV